MKNQRSDYNADRNKQIYDEYLTTDASFNALAKKYDLTPQRVSAIVNELKSKGIGAKLSTEESKEQRDAYKDQAVEMREKGSLDLSIKMFDEILAWDSAHKNNRGLTDILGHKKIALTLLADKTNTPEDKKKYLAEAVKCIEQGISVAETMTDFAPGNLAVQKVHMGSLLLQLSETQSAKEMVESLKHARRLLNDALKDLAGSKAHKAWPLAILSQVHIGLGAYDEALQCLIDAQKSLYAGYDEEMKYADQGRMKLRVWNTGIELGLARLYKETNKNILAEVHAQAVLETPDPEKILVARKKQAAQILKELE